MIAYLLIAYLLIGFLISLTLKIENNKSAWSNPLAGIVYVLIWPAIIFHAIFHAKHITHKGKVIWRRK